MIFAFADEAIEAAAKIHAAIGLGAFAGLLGRVPKLETSPERLPVSSLAMATMQRAHLAFTELRGGSAALAAPPLPDDVEQVLLAAGLIVNLAERAARGGTLVDRQAERHITTVRLHLGRFLASPRGIAA